MTTNPALLALADRWEKIAEEDGIRTISGSIHAAFANELRRTLAAPSAGVEVPGLLGMSDLLRTYGVETRSFADQAIAEAAFKAGVAAGKRAMETNTPPQVEYDRGLIAKMLDELEPTVGLQHIRESVAEQARLLRAADDREAAGVYTAKATPGDAEAEADGFALVPTKMYVAADAWESASFAFGGPATGEGEAYMDCTLWVGEVEQDDGSKLHGLHVSCDECPEEGCITLAQFPATTTRPAPPVVDEVVAWAVDRDGDRTFPRIYATEAEADHMVFNVTVNPPAKKRAVIGYEAVKAALTAALGKGEW